MENNQNYTALTLHPVPGKPQYFMFKLGTEVIGNFEYKYQAFQKLLSLFVEKKIPSTTLCTMAEEIFYLQSFSIMAESDFRKMRLKTGTFFTLPDYVAETRKLYEQMVGMGTFCGLCETLEKIPGILLYPNEENVPTGLIIFSEPVIRKEPGEKWSFNFKVSRPFHSRSEGLFLAQSYYHQKHLDLLDQERLMKDVENLELPDVYMNYRHTSPN